MSEYNEQTHKNQATSIKDKFLAVLNGGPDLKKGELAKKMAELGCYMMGLDRHGDWKYSNDIITELKNAAKAAKKAKRTKTNVYKKLYGGFVSWLTARSTPETRLALTSSTTCDEKHNIDAGPRDFKEEMPAYLLNAITKEKPVHPVYGKLRY